MITSSFTFFLEICQVFVQDALFVDFLGDVNEGWGWELLGKLWKIGWGEVEQLFFFGFLRGGQNVVSGNRESK